jgi:alkylation response protein AidB-like acyl-CoA dehydrogenase
MTDLARRDRAELDDFRDRFAVWMGEHRTELEPMRSLPSELDAQFGVQRRFQRELYEAGWLRRGWPESVGGLGGSVAIRGALAEELTRAGYVFPLALSMIEVLAPAVLRFGDPGLAAQMFPRFLSGVEFWCQGFSEPEAGSDLGSMRTQAKSDGDLWRVSGQKIWTSWAQFAQRCVLLVRTGEQVAADEDAERRWEGALALGRRLLAQEMLGVVAEQLRLAVRHALDRSQFGRPIGSFQAIQHKLADVYVGLTVADLATDEAWHDPSPSTCVLAKLLAGAAVDAANLHCQQVLGGIGFTWEHPFHRYLRRGRMLATMLGRRPQLASALGSEIVRSQRLPDLAPL